MSVSAQWKESVAKAIKDPAANAYDDVITTQMAWFNTTFAGTPQFPSLSLIMFRAILMVETSPAVSEWKTKPMQIGVKGDPALGALRAASSITTSTYCVNSAGAQIACSPADKGRLCTAAKGATEKEVLGIVMSPLLKKDILGDINQPALNVRAGMSYLLGRLAISSTVAVPDFSDTPRDYPVASGDSISSIAKKNSTTPEMIFSLNPGITKNSILKLGQQIKIQKSSLQRVISGWRAFTTTNIAAFYNGGGDHNYETKLNYVVGLINSPSP